MEHCGESIQMFMESVVYLNLSQYRKSCIAFDMLRQLIRPLT